MKKKIGILLSILLIMPVTLIGCGKDGKQLLQQSLQNSTNYQSSKAHFAFSIGIGQNGFSLSPSIDVFAEIDQDTLHMSFETDEFLSMAFFNRYEPTSSEFYAAKDQTSISIYSEDLQGDGYVQCVVPLNEFNFATFLSEENLLQPTSLSSLYNFSKSIKVTGSEEINGVLCDVVSVNLDFAKLVNLTQSSDKQLSNKEKLLIQSIGQCIDFNYYIRQNDLRMYGLKVGINDKLTSILNELMKLEDSQAVEITDLQLEVLLTVDYENPLEEIPSDVRNAQQVSEEEFIERSVFFSIFNSSDEDYNFVEEDSLDPWDSYDWDSEYDSQEYEDEFYEDSLGL